MGPASAALLADAHVLIIGVGGLGSPVGLFLAGAGVGEITLVDPDVVSLSNLHRQILFQEGDINEPKVDRAKKRLHLLNSRIKINAIKAAITPENVETFVAKATVVVDAADNFLTTYLLSDACLEKRVPLVSASVISVHGYVGVFCGTFSQPAPSMRALFPSPSGPSQNCNTAGVTGPSVGIIGSYQAQETLKVIMNDPGQLLGKLLYVDAWNYQHNLVDFGSANEPSSYASIVGLSTLDENDVLIDVRTAQEFAESSLNANAINVPLDVIKQGQFTLDHSERLVCLCASGQRALTAADILLKKGFSTVAVTTW